MLINNAYKDVFQATKQNDEKNLDFLKSALKSGHIDESAYNYLTDLYSDSMDCTFSPIVYRRKNDSGIFPSG